MMLVAGREFHVAVFDHSRLQCLKFVQTPILIAEGCVSTRVTEPREEKLFDNPVCIRQSHLMI
jgi:hypothetical protein